MYSQIQRIRIRYLKQEFLVQNTHDVSETFETQKKRKHSKRFKHFQTLFCSFYKLHNSYFVFFV